MKPPVDGYLDKYCILLNKLPHDHATKLREQFLLDLQLLLHCQFTLRAIRRPLPGD
jgi:hypothetical protein